MKRIFYRAALIILIAAIVTGAALGAVPAQKNPKQCLKTYYVNINNKEFRSAYKLRSNQYRMKTSFSEWKESWKNNVNVGYYTMSLKKNDGRTAVLVYNLSSVDRKPNGKKQLGAYKVRATLTKKAGYWWIHRFQVKVLDKHEFHGFEAAVPGRTAKPFPEDIPVYPGFEMGNPLVIYIKPSKRYVNRVFAMERVKGVEPQKVADFYINKMRSKGWKVQGPAGGSTCMGLYITKGDRKVSISIYNTTWFGTEAPVDPRGTMLMISY